MKWYLDDGPFNHSGRRIYESAAGQWRLTFGEKRRILLEHLRGVDIDPNAVDVTVFSLLLKLTEGENEAALKEFVRTQKQAALPDLCGVVRCGNSLVSIGEWQAACGPMPIPARKKINPFTWADEFPTETNGGGFSVIIGESALRPNPEHGGIFAGGDALLPTKGSAPTERRSRIISISTHCL